MEDVYKNKKELKKALKSRRNWICPKCNLQYSSLFKNCIKCGYSPDKAFWKHITKIINSSQMVRNTNNGNE